ncbi:unnamed protein product [Paramecium primaurelia]|uniref:Uncharacterized protein n=1 Tax=Paramecium primaurelia TaxID=5886 RepID=A0A8S1NCX9_PARPR|nr:unnamed protein product [Paramecium primaurelia]
MIFLFFGIGCTPQEQMDIFNRYKSGTYIIHGLLLITTKYSQQKRLSFIIKCIIQQIHKRNLQFFKQNYIILTNIQILLHIIVMQEQNHLECIKETLKTVKEVGKLVRDKKVTTEVDVYYFALCSKMLFRELIHFLRD